MDRVVSYRSWTLQYWRTIIFEIQQSHQAKHRSRLQVIQAIRDCRWKRSRHISQTPNLHPFARVVLWFYCRVAEPAYSYERGTGGCDDTHGRLDHRDNSKQIQTGNRTQVRLEGDAEKFGQKDANDGSTDGRIGLCVYTTRKGGIHEVWRCDD